MNLKKTYQRIFRSALLLAMIMPSLLLSQDPPEEFQFSQSTLQAFYFFTDVTLNGEPIESDDWVAAFKGEICVGARQWDTSVCGGGLCDLPVMGDDGSEYAVGYMEIGDVPTFKIYDASSQNIFNAIPSEEVDLWSIHGFSMNDLLEASEVIIGCTDDTACNYDLNATEPCTDCCLYTEDCAGECGGSAEDLGCGCNIEGPSGCDNECGSILENDTCGECGGDDSTCTGCMDELACNFDESNIIENNEECEYPQQNFDCDGNCTVAVDCNNVCGGGAFIDDCDVCVGGNTGIDVDSCPLDCAGITGGSAFMNECGDCICNGSEPANGFECSEVDECTQDCNGDWGGTAEIDDCGICDGGSVCSGQIVQGQCVNGDFIVGEFNVAGFDCEGWCLGTFTYGADGCYDCSGTPNGDAWQSDCGCVSADNTGDDCDDCDGVPNGNALLDECGICNGDGLSCLFGCDDVNASNYYCDEDNNMCENSQSPEGYFDDGSCTYNIEGTVVYFLPFFPQNYIENVIVTLYGSALGIPYEIDSALTGENGTFNINNVPIKNSDDENNEFSYEYFYFDFIYVEDAENNYTGINNTDASLILDVVVAESTFIYPIHSSIAADVNLDGRINSYDSSLIGRLMNDSSFSMNELDIRWKFVSEMDTIYDITNLSGNDNILIHGIKLGDPNGSWE